MLRKELKSTWSDSRAEPDGISNRVQHLLYWETTGRMKNSSRKLLDEVESSAGFDRLTARSKMKTHTVLGLYCGDRVWRGLRLAALESGLYIPPIFKSSCTGYPSEFWCISALLNSASAKLTKSWFSGFVPSHSRGPVAKIAPSSESILPPLSAAIFTRVFPRQEMKYGLGHHQLNQLFHNATRAK